jgi:hypothetical protein
MQLCRSFHKWASILDETASYLPGNIYRNCLPCRVQVLPGMWPPITTKRKNRQMKKILTSTCGKFTATKIEQIPVTDLPISGIHYQVVRIETSQTIGHIYLDQKDNRFKFSSGCLTILAGMDFLDLQFLLTDVRKEYKKWKKLSNFWDNLQK